jgi:MYXO-CTERM domain-containing protein
MRPALAAALAIALTGCAPDADLDVGKTVQLLEPQVELERVTAIRDVSAGVGLTNAALIAGIAQSETGLVHCWSEATWACQGPNSPSCDGGPVIAGAADGPCSDRQGGLGMFQFDAGTYEDTLARDGEDILLLEGNIAKGVEFVVDRVIEEIDGADNQALALAWLNSIPMVAGDPLMEEWASMIVCRYNGCCNSSATCVERRNNYRDNAIELYQKYGATFWETDGSGCEPIGRQGRTIDENDACYIRGGDPQYWRRADSGHDGGQDWTYTIAGENHSNYGIWRLDFEAGGSYRIEVYLDGITGQSRQAGYEISHSGEIEVVSINQAEGGGWVELGEFDFAAGGQQHVLLGDNTGEPNVNQVQIAFDAIRVSPTGVDGGCGCRATGGPDRSLVLFGLLTLLVVARPRRRRR